MKGVGHFPQTPPPPLSVYSGCGVLWLSLLPGRDNYGFVTYRYAEEAFAAIEGGHSLHHPDEQPFDLCFGGRRQFCRRSYTDLGESLEMLTVSMGKQNYPEC